MFTLAIWWTLTKILQTVTVTKIQVFLIEIQTGVMVVRHHSRSGLTFSRISHITDCTLFCRSSFSLFFCLLYIIIPAMPWAFTLVHSSTGHDQVPTFFMCCEMYVMWNNCQLLHNKVIIQRRICNNTKASFTQVWPHNYAQLCDSMIMVCYYR